jgi:hypothetical protein
MLTIRIPGIILINHVVSFSHELTLKLFFLVVILYALIVPILIYWVKLMFSWIFTPTLANSFFQPCDSLSVGIFGLLRGLAD